MGKKHKGKRYLGGNSGKIDTADARLAQGNFTLPSPDDVRRAMSRYGGWTALQLAEWGIKWPPQKGWREALRQRWLAAHPGWRSSLPPEPIFAWEQPGAVALEYAIREERAYWGSEMLDERMLRDRDT